MNLPDEIISKIMNMKQIPKYDYMDELHRIIRNFDFLQTNIILCVSQFDNLKIKTKYFNTLFFTCHRWFRYGMKSPNAYFNGVNTAPHAPHLDVVELLIYVKNIMIHYYNPNQILDIYNDFDTIFYNRISGNPYEDSDDDDDDDD